MVSCVPQQTTPNASVSDTTPPHASLSTNTSLTFNTTFLNKTLPNKHGCETFGVDITMNETGASLCKKQGYNTCKSFVIETYVAFYASKYGQCVGGQPQKDLWKTVQKYTCYAPIVVKPKQCISNQRTETKTDSSAEQLAKITCCSD